MAWSPLLLLLLSQCTGRDSLQRPKADPQPGSLSCDSDSQSTTVLTQPPYLSASLGSTARLSCTLSSDLSVGGKNMYWYQQKPGSPPQLYLYYYSDSDKQLGPGVPNRFSGSKDASTNTAFLHISGLQPEDEADYYCQVANVNIFKYTRALEYEKYKSDLFYL
uniref:Ig-like domain-containing protein n=1 Tax=Sciurus vulgaris TaxID=55149 RepID=A0A8D2D4N8_SCIVU